MSDPHIKRASLAEIRKMKEKVELFHDPNAPEGESLGPDFWAGATLEAPKKPRSVHLKLDPDVFDFFFEEAKGKGHLTRMQNVLKAYVNAKTAKRRA
ncbi:BrnA antitoxin family protein [Xanthobacter dioxanivorans]|uniref:BrnA antitoxin family protein n=1 Tax=Xanthobacter dioxanivorans TaxID=2528964 RepID=A0A974PTC1_9HYPH|nr:BrnA antitoxin family protein [Xanthobacter dioxanivorans]QRG08735.1 BrnA antitoxin family protein [Xanthobacter dioxanivorans]